MKNELEKSITEIIHNLYQYENFNRQQIEMVIGKDYHYLIAKYYTNHK